VILLCVVLFVVVRNMVKLVLERAAAGARSKLRTRLVISFLTLSIVPTVLMFGLGALFVQTSVDFCSRPRWRSRWNSPGGGQAFYASSQERLERAARARARQRPGRRMTWGGKAMDTYLGEKRAEYDLGLLGCWGRPRRALLARRGPWAEVWPEIRDRVDWDGLRERPEFWSTIRPGPGADMVVGVLPVDGGAEGFLVLGETIGHGLLYKLDHIVRGVSEYKQIRTMKHQWKLALYVLLAVVTLLIVMGAIWFGMRLAKELSAPAARPWPKAPSAWPGAIFPCAWRTSPATNWASWSKVSTRWPATCNRAVPG
jgi:two-component system nitrogen regulation sensor histidine kinase NtrY